MALDTSGYTNSTFSTQVFMPRQNGYNNAGNLRESPFSGFYHNSQLSYSDKLLAEKSRSNPFHKGQNSYLDNLKSSAEQTSAAPGYYPQPSYTAQIRRDYAQNMNADYAQNNDKSGSNKTNQSYTDDLKEMINDNLSDEAVYTSTPDIQNNYYNNNNYDGKTNPAGLNNSQPDNPDYTGKYNHNAVNKTDTDNRITDNNQPSNINSSNQSQSANSDIQIGSADNSNNNNSQNRNTNSCKPQNTVATLNISDQNSSTNLKISGPQTHAPNSTAASSANMSNPFHGFAFTRINNQGNINSNYSETGTSGKSSAAAKNLNLTNAPAFSSQAVKGIMAVLRTGGGALTMKLEPESLGQLRVQMSMNGANVSVQFHTDSYDAKALLQQSMDVLKSALEQNGLKLEQVTIQPLSRVTESGTNGEQVTDRDKSTSPGNEKENEHNAADQRSRGYTEQKSAGQDRRGSENQPFNSPTAGNPNQSYNWVQQLDDVFGTHQ